MGLRSAEGEPTGAAADTAEAVGEEPYASVDFGRGRGERRVTVRVA